MQRTVRELAGEIWAELVLERRRRSASDNSALGSLGVDVEGVIIDLVLGVLARYDGFEIKNDSDLPVVPLPREAPDPG